MHSLIHRPFTYETDQVYTNKDYRFSKVHKPTALLNVGEGELSEILVPFRLPLTGAHGRDDSKPLILPLFLASIPHQ